MDAAEKLQASDRQLSVSRWVPAFSMQPSRMWNTKSLLPGSQATFQCGGCWANELSGNATGNSILPVKSCTVWDRHHVTDRCSE